jgi:hypothetical protein
VIGGKTNAGGSSGSGTKRANSSDQGSDTGVSFSKKSCGASSSGIESGSTDGDGSRDGDGDKPGDRKPNPNSKSDLDDNESEDEAEEEGEEEHGEEELEAFLDEQGLGDQDDDQANDEENETHSFVPSSNSSVQGSPTHGAGTSSGAAGPTPAEGKKDWLSYKELMETTYPVKSRKLYLAAFVTLEKYLKRKGSFDPESPPNQLSLLNYFHYLRTDKKWVATTLWSHFSRINAVMKRTWGVNLSTKYPRLTDLLKGYESGHRVKKASVFSPQQEILTIVIS